MATNGSDKTAGAIEHLHEDPSPSPESITVPQKDYVKPSDAPASSQTLDVSAKARDMTTRILDFLSNASNETLGACIVALGATTWLVLGRVGLVIIGLVGGVVLHATWEGSGESSANDEAGASEARKRREKGLDIVGRVLDWRERTRGQKEPENYVQQSKTLDFSEFLPDTAAALTGLTDAVIRDYVK